MLEAPASTEVFPSVLVIDRSAWVPTLVVAVALLLLGVGSDVPVGVLTEAVFEIVPVALTETVAVTVNVAVAPLFRLIERLMLPLLPETGVPQLLPVATGETEQLQEVLPSDAGKASTTLAPTTFAGPLFVTTMLYVSVPPAVTGSGLSVFVMARSARLWAKKLLPLLTLSAVRRTTVRGRGLPVFT